MFIFETTSDEDSPLSAATTMSSSNNEEGSGGGGQRNNTDYIEESVIPGFFDIIIVKIFHNFSLNIFFRTSH